MTHKDNTSLFYQMLRAKYPTLLSVEDVTLFADKHQSWELWFSDGALFPSGRKWLNFSTLAVEYNPLFGRFVDDPTPYMHNNPNFMTYIEYLVNEAEKAITAQQGDAS